MALTPSTMSPLGQVAPPFRLKNTQNQWVELKDYQEPALLVIFMCNHCPFVVHLHDHLLQWIKHYQRQGLGVVAINANDAEAYPQDGPQAMKEMHQNHRYTFEYLFDETQEVARAYRAACTPDFFLYDQDRKLAYRGQFDSSRPSNGVKVTGEDLSKACDLLLSTGSIPQDFPQYPSIGCNIKWKA